MADEMLAQALAGRGWPGRPLADQRPAVDLLNTRWMTGDRSFDVLDDDELTGAWLADRGLGPPTAPAHLRGTRDALAAAVAHSVGPLNVVLDRGRVRLHLGDDGPVETPDVVDPAWRAAWACARDYVDIVAHAPGRIRKCANPPCPLHFLDISRKGDRRWCSMAVCGNRSKARLHRERRA